MQAPSVGSRSSARIHSTVVFMRAGFLVGCLGAHHSTGSWGPPHRGCPLSATPGFTRRRSVHGPQGDTGREAGDRGARTDPDIAERTVDGSGDGVDNRG